ncbi:MAG: type II toxin-antitoxin system HicB family antitoxin [Candidatus Aenigmarchaeota archaeon]|nr:type II toxin-antitoxin system HicB family antitoxin [Candidatus Aenigmarchaeota archaeon]
MPQTYNVIIEKDEEGWFVSEVVELPGCHTQARTKNELLERTREAIKAYLEDAEGVEESVKFVEMQQIKV